MKILKHHHVHIGTHCKDPMFSTWSSTPPASLPRGINLLHKLQMFAMLIRKSLVNFCGNLLKILCSFCIADLKIITITSKEWKLVKNWTLYARSWIVVKKKDRIILFYTKFQKRITITVIPTDKRDFLLAILQQKRRNTHFYLRISLHHHGD